MNNDSRSGGLYSKVNMSVRSANILVAVSVLVLVAVSVFILKHGGFTVSFDTDGGSQIESVRVMHSETVPDPGIPVKEGSVFTGWYADREHSVPWNIEADTVTGSMTLYAGWSAKQ